MSSIVKKLLIIAGAVVLAGVGAAAGYSVSTQIDINKDGDTVVKTQTNIVLDKEQKQAQVDEMVDGQLAVDGEVVTDSIATVESVDAPVKADDNQEHGRGWWTPTDTPEAFILANKGYCIDTDGWYGAQCWDLGNLFWQNVTNRSLSTCGTGAAKGIMNCWEYNAGDEFDMVWDPAQIQTGDWVIFGNGEFGHIGMAAGDYNNGYVALFGQNQGGVACAGGGSTGNIINISLSNFTGAFRYKKYVKPIIIPETGMEYLGE